MKLRKGKAEYKTPPLGRVDQALVEGNQTHNQMCSIMLRQIGLDDSLRLDFDFRGLPTVFVINPVRNTIKFWPTPDRPYKVCVRYQPPMQEI